MPGPFAAIETNMAQVTGAMLADVIVTRFNGDQFPAELNASDHDAHDTINIDADILIVPVAYRLTPGEVLTIDTTSYKVLAPPRRVDAHFAAVEIAKQ